MGMTILSLLVLWTAVGGLVGMTVGQAIARGDAEARGPRVYDASSSRPGRRFGVTSTPGRTSVRL